MKVEKSQSLFEYVGEVSGDKSITHRAVMLLSLARGGGKIYKPLMSYDTEATIEAFRKLGGRINITDEYIEVFPINNPYDCQIDCQNSGTTMRLLMGIVAALGVNVTLTGDDSLKKRPMARVSDYICSMGGNVSTTNGFAPVSIKPQLEKKQCHINLSIPSAQVKSAIILFGLLSSIQTTLVTQHQTRDHTERMIKYLGGDIEVCDTVITVKNSQLTGSDITVCGDISSAAFVMAASAIDGHCIIKNVGINPTRAGILKVFDMFGVRYSISNMRDLCGEPICDIEVFKSVLSPITICGDIIANIIDEIPIIAVMMCFCNGKSVVRDAKELRIKESDRIALIVSNLKKAGVEVEELEDGFEINAKGGVYGGEQTIITHGDHRIAMAFSVLAKNSQVGLDIDDIDCVGVSFKEFRNIFAI